MSGLVTQYGSQVRIVARHHDYETSGWVDVEFLNASGPPRSVHIANLRADGGAKEIDAAAQAAPIKPKPVKPAKVK